MSGALSLSQLRESMDAYDAGSGSEDETFRAALEVLFEVAKTALDLSDAGAEFAKLENTKPLMRGPRRDAEVAAMRAETVHLAALARVSR